VVLSKFLLFLNNVGPKFNRSKVGGVEVGFEGQWWDFQRERSNF
jgi:hypothetical protein